MMSCSFVTAAQAENYFGHTKDYYTKNQTNYDRWHGTLAAAYGLKGELSKEQFDQVLETINNAGRKRAGLDCTFSVPKSVSLATAKDEQTRLDMTEAHQAAVKRAIDKIEMELLQTRSNGKTFLSRNAIIAEFLHTTARPTEKNNFVPDLDLHSHCVILNKTTADGKDLSQEFGKVNAKEKIKELGLIYRQELARELQGKGYMLEITDSRQGFFELKGFDRETVMEYSNRRQEMLEVAQEHGITDMQIANQYSRNKKEAGAAEYEEILEQVKKDLFDSGKIKIEKIERNVSNANDQQRTDGNSRELRLHEVAERQRDFTNFAESESLPLFEGFEGKSSLQDLPRFDLDAESKRPNLLLSQSVLNRLAKFQSDKVRSHFVQREERRERLVRIDRIAADTLKTLSREKYAFSIPDAKQRIMAAGVLQAITADEAKAAMERAGLVKLGKTEHEGQKTKDVYVTTRQNIEIEKAVLDRVQNGKGVITEVLSIEESRAALDRAENKAKAAGKTDFVISKGEQGEAVHHILVSSDKYIAVDGLAGTGKTTLMERLKWVADEKGIEIKGVCFTGKAADGLQAGSGIESTTIHSFLNKLERGDMNREAQAGGYARGRVRTLVSKAQADMINRKNVHQQKGIKQEWDFSQVRHLPKGQREIWAVDEAGLVDMQLMNQLQRAAEARGAQVLLLGDPDQLPPVGAGEPMRQMEEKGMATAHLYDIRRQKDAELLKAVRESVQGDHIKTYEVLEAKGNYREVQDKAARMNDIKAEMTAAPVAEYGKNLLLVSTNADRKAYNKAIRAEYVERGELKKGKSYKVTVHDGEKDRTEKRDFAPKDRIIFTANDKRLGVMNGTMATIERIDGNQITARTDGKEGSKTVTFDMEKYNSIDHSYAVTNYKAQGMTVSKVVADMNTKGAAQSRNALYVDISRARENAVVYTDSKEKLEKQTKDFAHKVTSKDFEKRLEAMRERGGITNNDRYHAPQDKGKALENALKQIEQHTKAPAMVQEWGKNIEAKQEQERQRAARAAEQVKTKTKKVKTVEKSEGITFSR